MASRKLPKTFVVRKVNTQLIAIQQSDDSRDFAQKKSSGSSKSVDSEVMQQAIKANPVISIS